MSYMVDMRNYLKDRSPPIPRNTKEISVAYVCYLPFRINTGKIIKYDCSFEGNIVDIWIYNEIPNELSPEELRSLVRKNKGFAPLASKILIHFKNPPIDKNKFSKVVELIKTGKGQDPTMSIISKPSIPLNRLLVACNAVTDEIFSGEKIHKISEYELLMGGVLCVEYTVIAHTDFSFSKDKVEEIMDYVPPSGDNVGRWSGLEKPVSKEQMQKVQEVLNRYLDNILFYDFLFEAKSNERTDLRIALIQAVTALENALWLIMKFEFEERVHQIKNSLEEENEKSLLTPSYIERIIDDFARELGLTQLVKTLPVLFPDNLMLKPSEIKLVVSAIKTRNKFMHSKTTRVGKYHWHEVKERDLVEQYYPLYALVLMLGDKIQGIIDEMNLADTSIT
ncbi:MAG: hypothetical protein KKA79_07080 [Nanoarchaeota archaeon]|nr:hypothetical protein [Nanoarchaeota archaeon]